jgi:hypothetical protein
MSYLVRARLDPNTVSGDKQQKFDDWVAEHDDVLDDSEYRSISKRQDGTMEAYDELTGRFSVNSDVNAIVSSLVGDYYTDCDWLVVHTRKEDSEASETTYIQDSTYYEPGMSNGLRSDVTVDKTDSYTVSYDSVEAVVGGSEVSSASGQITVDEPDDEAKIVNLTVESDGSVVVDGSGYSFATVEVHPAKIVSIETEEFALESTDWGDAVEVRGSPSDYLVDESIDFPDRKQSEYVDRVNLSQDTANAILTARDNNNTQEQIDHILDVLDVIDL